MRKISSRFIRLLAISAFAGIVAACGSGTNNDQGVSFTLFSITPTNSEVPLSTDTGDGTTTGAVTGTYGLQNNLAVQGIRVQRIFLRFFVEGADSQPPDTTVSAGGILGPAGGATGVTGSLPPGFENIPSTLTLSSYVVPVEIMSWLNLNRATLPEPPYSLQVEAYVTGLTTAGDRIESNVLTTTVGILPDVVLNPAGDPAVTG